MIAQSIFEKTSIPVLKKILDVSCLRQRVIADNIANATTPGYKKKEVLFEEKLKDALSFTQIKGVSTNKGHLSIGGRDIRSIKPEVRESADSRPSGAVNNVNIDEEMSKLAQNQLTFYVSARLLTLRIRAIKNSIIGRL